jgi:outer membrane protein OmpA-like peptidoglycan-associated protein
MTICPRGRLSIKLACLVVASGLVLSVGSAMAQQRPTEQQILDALKPAPAAPKTRGLTAEPVRQNPQEQQFIESLRTVKTRSLSTAERQQVAEIAKTKPKIDLEIYFNYNSADITPKAVPDLMTLGRALTSPDLQGGVFVVSGHTDAKGGEEYNQHLSERRAQSVKRFLIDKFRMSEDSLVTAGYGKEQLKNSADPFAPENRRVQIVNMEGKATAAK